jgi:glucose-6-phosphate 1-dehydrogenase
VDDAKHAVADGPLSHPRLVDPCAFVILGAGGDLTKRLLLPALYNLAAQNVLPDGFAVVGMARRAMSDEQFRTDMHAALRAFATRPLEPALTERFLARLSFVGGDLDDSGAYGRLRDRLADLARGSGAGNNAIFYLATPPDVFATAARQLGAAGLARESAGAWRRLVVEKPFGTDLPSARALNAELLASFSEPQIFRIDHYLGKETVQNIMVLRFGNGLFEPLWNREQIDHVQITVAEALSVGTRGKFYDHVGALRDMVPNHLFQLLALTAMEPPIRFDADAVRGEKLKVIKAIPQLKLDDCIADVVRGQYEAARLDGREMPAYRDSPGVGPDSQTETYVAMRLLIDNWRWAGVPFYLRTGKSLATRKTEIAIKFKQAPFAMFRDSPVDRLAQNFLVLRIQPDEGVSLQFNAKIPGPTIRIDGVRMDFKYRDHFDAAPSTGYETLLYDCMLGDPTLFQSADDIEAGWKVVQPILDSWEQDPDHCPPAPYRSGTHGPREADEMLARDGREWRPIVPEKRDG